MATNRATNVMLAICTVILVAAALYLCRPIMAPFFFAIFMVAIVWPLQRALEKKLPQFVALLLTWALSVEREWLAGHAGRFQSLYLDWQAGWKSTRSSSWAHWPSGSM